MSELSEIKFQNKTNKKTQIRKRLILDRFIGGL